MQTQIKRYNILLKGKVQHIGYRGIIESTARKLDIKGYVFNDIDGSVKIACEGFQNSVDIFINNLKEFARADIASIEKNEIQEDLYLPSVFSRVATDGYYEFGKKFDVGIDFLSEIKTDTGDMKCTLGNMDDTLGDIKGSLININTTLETFIEKQDEHNQRLDTFIMKQDEHSIKQDEHNKRLEQILEKLIEK